MKPGPVLTPVLGHARPDQIPGRTTDDTDALPENVGAQRHQAAQLTARSNIFVERLWRTIKYEEVYLHAYDSVAKRTASSRGTSIFTIASAAISPWTA